MKEEKKGGFPYADLLDLPRPAKHCRPAMSMQARAAQFAPFEALVGYGEAVEEAACAEELAMQGSARLAAPGRENK